MLVDTYGASLLGYSKQDIDYIGVAERVGAGSADLTKAKIHEYDTDLKNGSRFKPSGRAQRLAEKVIAKEACSACYGGLIHALQRLSDKDLLRRLKDPHSYRPGLQRPGGVRPRRRPLRRRVLEQCGRLSADRQRYRRLSGRPGRQNALIRLAGKRRGFSFLPLNRLQPIWRASTLPARPFPAAIRCGGSHIRQAHDRPLREP